MKKLILLLAIIIGITISESKAQTLVLTDTLLTSQADTVFQEWYHVKFIDSDQNNTLISVVQLKKKYVFNGITYLKTTKTFKYNLFQGDSILNPYGSNYFTYDFVKNYIYTQGEDMKRTLSLYQLLNRPDRVFE